MTITKPFQSLELKGELLKNLESLGFKAMTPVQQESLPLVLKGDDLIVQAKTGSGKTAAFGLGILNKLQEKKFAVQALIICPTRELADQVSSELRRLARYTQNIKVLTLCGGDHEYKQNRSLDHGAHIVVGTPGRLLKFLQKGILDLHFLKTLVLDEADRMLDMGFSDVIHEIIACAPKQRQTLLFSATFPPQIKVLSQDIQNAATFIKIDSTHEPNVIKQYFYEVAKQEQKIDALFDLLTHYQPESCVIFCRTKLMCDDIAGYLQDEGLSALAIHGDLEQSERTLVLTKFSNKSCLILVATDVAARGLDIKELEAVINFDLTSDPEVYVHRIGRTGRAGHEGLALSLFTPKEREKIKTIEAYTKRKVFIENSENLKREEPVIKEPLFKTLLISGGKKQNLRPGDILGALTKDAGLKGSDVGQIKIMDTISYVAVSSDKATRVAKFLNGSKIKNLRFRVHIV